MKKYKEGDIVRAKITSIEKYGAFASLDEEYSGLIHISEISEKFVEDITDYFTLGEEINVKILDISKANNQLKLSAKNVNEGFNSPRKKKIKETVFGFYLLKNALPGWVEKKMNEINKKS